MILPKGMVISLRKSVIQATEPLSVLPRFPRLTEDFKIHTRYTIVSINTMVWGMKCPESISHPIPSVALRTTDPLPGQSGFFC